jgi:PIN domain nuclease of toxin-antitoxin system
VSRLLDASALIALLRDEPGAPQVELVLRQGDAGMTAVNLAEALDVLGRRHRVLRVSLRDTLAPLIGLALAVWPVDEALAWRAADLRGRHYHRRDAPLSLADCLLLAAAGPTDAIVTADDALERVARAEGIEVVGVPRGG